MSNKEMQTTPQALTLGPSGRCEVKAAATASGAGDDSAEIRIYGDIGENFWAPEQSNTAAKLAEQLDAIDTEYLTVRINSVGGSVVDALAIHNALKRHPAAVTVEIDGAAMSAASMIAMAGDTVRMVSNGLLMIHAPWTVTMGNSRDMRSAADLLDKYSDAMAASYARNGVDRDEALALLTDGEDHFYTAEEAVAAGFVDAVSDALPVAATAHRDMARLLARAPSNRPAAAAAQQEEPSMATDASKPAAPDPQAANVTEIESAYEQRLQARNEQIKAAFHAYMHRDGVAALYAEQVGNPKATLEQAQSALLAHLAKDVEPIAGPQRTEAGLDERDKRRQGISAVLARRMGAAKDDVRNEFRGLSLAQLAGRCLEAEGESTSGMTRNELAGRVLAAHTTSDFPFLFQDAANKSLQRAYDAFPDTWRQIAAVGEVTDFKTVHINRLGSFSSLDLLREGAEYTQGTTSEEQETLQAQTKGKFIQVTRQMIVNDDLTAFARLAAMLGRAAARTVNNDVYSVLTANANMSNGRAIFNTTDKTLASNGSAISVASLSSARTAMRKYTDPADNEYLNIMPRTLLVPVVLEDHARTVLTSEHDTDTTGSRKRNPIRDWGPLEIVSDPALDTDSATSWYLVTDPMDVPLLEVRFLDGNQTPFVDDEEEFLVDAIRWKVRMDYGVAAIDRRGGYKNAGA